jgi:aspartate ammonia-lyase
MELELMPVEKGGAIVKACDEILAGAHISQFVIDIFHGGSGTAFNMNANEIIANRALEIGEYPLGSYGVISPFDDVNMSQGDADVFNSAARIAVIAASQKLTAALNELKSAFLKKSLEFDFLLKPARTNFRDSVPITLGQEFLTYAETVKKCVEDIENARKRLYYLNIGGTEAGTGFNSHAGFIDIVISKLAEITRISVEKSEDLVEITASAYDFMNYTSRLKNLAASLIKISSEISLLASGPAAGFNEITIPPLMPGSSMVPAKFNPVALENMSMVAMQISGIDHIVTQAAINTPPDLNVNMPLITYNLLFGLKILTNAVAITTERCVAEITANEEILKANFENSPALIAALVPRIGYSAAAAAVGEAKKQGKTVLKFISEKQLMTSEEIETLKTARRISEPGFLLKK